MGRSTTQLVLTQGDTVADLWELFTDSHAEADVLCAVNENYVSKNQRLENGDEVAFFPPVTGG